MSSPPENMKLECLIEDNWDEGVATPGVVALLEPYRQEIEDIAERFDPDTQSWRDYRSAVWSPVPEAVMDQVRVMWILASDATAPDRWILREGEPNIDSADGVDLLLRDRYEMADLACAGVVITTHEETGAGLVARVRFPPRCLRSRFVAGVGISVILPNGEAILEGNTMPWSVRAHRQAHPGSLRDLPLAILAAEVMSRGAFVVFEEPTDFGPIVNVIAPLLDKFIAEASARHTADQPPPMPNEGRPIWDLVIADVGNIWAGGDARDRLMADMAERDRNGRERYGTPLQANNGRDAVVDAYQEALDGTAYMRQKIEESPSDVARCAYHDFLAIAYQLCGMIARMEKT